MQFAACLSACHETGRYWGQNWGVSVEQLRIYTILEHVTEPFETLLTSQDLGLKEYCSIEETLDWLWYYRLHEISILTGYRLSTLQQSLQQFPQRRPSSFL